MNSRQFGPLGWSLLHTLPISIGGDDVTQKWSTQEIEMFCLFVYSFALVLPCVHCRTSFRVFVRAIDLRKWIQGPTRLQPVTALSAGHYVHILHNLVNQKLDKPWFFGYEAGLQSNLLRDEQAIIHTMFRWLYTLFANYPDFLAPKSDAACKEKCCGAACQQYQQTCDNQGQQQHYHDHSELQIKFLHSKTHCGDLAKNKTPPRNNSQAFKDCPAQRMRDLFREISQKLIQNRFLSAANAQGVTLGSYVTKHAVAKALKTFDAADCPLVNYDITKISWYIIHIHALTQMFLHSTKHGDNVEFGTIKSQKAVRCLRKIRSVFLLEAFLAPKAQTKKPDTCICELEGQKKCMQHNLGVWSGFDSAIANLWEIESAYDGYQCLSFEETLKSIEAARA